MKTIFGKVMRIGRATVFLVGMSVILAVVFGVGSMALAANGKPFLLGKNNAASAITTLVKQGPGPALRLLARPGNPPMAVNSRVRVANLNADKVDGKDASQLTRVAFFADDSLIGAGANGTLATATINAPASGFLVIAASSEVRNVNSSDQIICKIEVNDIEDTPSVRFIETNGFDSINREENCSTDAVVSVPAGTHVVDLEADLVNESDTTFAGTTLSAVYVPFDGQGNAP